MFLKPRLRGLELGDNLAELSTLGEGNLEFQSGRLSGAVSTGDSTSTPCGATVDLVQVGQLAKDWRKAQRNVDHTVVGQGRKQVDNGGLVTTAGTGGDEDTGRLMVEGTLLPQTACGIDEGLHLGWQVTKSSWEAEDDPVGLSEDVWGGNWVVWLGWGVHLGQYLLAEGFCDLVNGSLVAGGFDTLLYLLGEGCHMVVHGVDDDCDVSHCIVCMCFGCCIL